MCGGFNQGEVLRVVNSEKVEIHVGNDVSGRRCFRCRIYGPIAANQHQRQEYGGKKKTDSQTSVFHKDSLSATTNNRHLSETPQVECPFFGFAHIVVSAPGKPIHLNSTETRERRRLSRAI